MNTTHQTKSLVCGSCVRRMKWSPALAFFPLKISSSDSSDLKVRLQLRAQECRQSRKVPFLPAPSTPGGRELPSSVQLCLSTVEKAKASQTCLRPRLPGSDVKANTTHCPLLSVLQAQACGGSCCDHRTEGRKAGSRLCGATQGRERWGCSAS